MLLSRLSADAHLVQGCFVGLLGPVFQAVSMLVVGFLIGFIHSWKLSLVILSVFPVIALASGLEWKVYGMEETKIRAPVAEADRLAGEAISNIRTVAAFNAEEHTIHLYRRLMDNPLKTMRKQAIIAGLAVGFSQGVVIGTYALCFW